MRGDEKFFKTIPAIPIQDNAIGWTYRSKLKKGIK